MSSRETAAPGGAYAWYVVAILLLAYTLSFIDRMILSLLVGPIRADLGLSDTTDYPFHGSIDFADNQVDASTGTMKIRAVFENPKRLLTPGMFARVRIPEQAPHQAVLIPDMAILTDQNLKYVWVVDSSGSVSRRTIKLGQVTQGLREVASGLKAEDEIVIIGIQKVREGAKVSTKLVTFDDLGQVVQGDSAKQQASNKAAEPTVNHQATLPSAPAK